MNRATLLVLVSMGCSYSGPPCEDITHSDLQADLSTGVPVFTWTGDPANDIYVVAPDGGTTWELDCACKNEVDHPNSNKGCQDQVDWDFRACLSPPISYGVAPTPTVGSIREGEDNDAMDLISGDEYTVTVYSICTATDQRMVEATTTFTAP